MNDLMLEETEEERAARIRAWRTRAALRNAADLVAHARALGVSGQTERGEVLREFVAPLRITPVDDADSTYAQLVNWVIYWAETLNIEPPSASVVAWSNLREVQGFRAGTTVEGAEMLVRVQTMWLLIKADQIEAHPAAKAFQDDVLEILRTMRGRYPTAPRPEKPVSPRPCPVCRQPAVQAEWFGEDVHDVEVKCASCGYTIEPKSYARILDWLA